jgi:hypothetical protein
LAGDVTVSVLNGNLLVMGDSVDNDITIEQGTTADSFVVTGIGTTGGNTTINGGTNIGTFTGVTHNITVRMNGGDDTVSVLADLAAPGSLSISMGSGDNTVAIGAGTTINNNLAITTAGGDDTVTVTDTTVNGSANIQTGGGDDSVTLTGLTVGEDTTAAAASQNVFGNSPLGRFLNALFQDNNGSSNGQAGLTVDTGAGDDTVLASELTVHGSAKIETGFGDDTVSLTDVTVDNQTTGGGAADMAALLQSFLSNQHGNGLALGHLKQFLRQLNGDDNQGNNGNGGGNNSNNANAGGLVVDTGFGDDTVTITGLSAAKLAVSTGAGADTVDLSEIDVDGLVSIDTGIGDDDVTLDTLAAARLDVNTGAGNDTVNIIAAALERLNVDLGAGDDSLTTSADTTISGQSKLAGGAGTDTIDSLLAVGISLNKLHSWGFETNLS